ncbi:hypothetical protein [Winogradskya humida]|uniref:HemY protein n=1 Tax=Winogradskya humida TaxID=113566 RepID=A0ABQ4A1C6_9ACTN|nr:hypothetical protein [Actinoplanes humidus]GIE24649.1 hypothetical protein Ahu01nite_077510 [Actinoplanes humidus]
MMLTLIAVFILLIATNVYFLWGQPRLRRRSLLTAIPLLYSEVRSELETAEGRLAEALVNGLGARDTRDARFALAWVRARLGEFDRSKYADALTALGAVERDDTVTTDLRLWLLAKQGRHDEVLALAGRAGVRLSPTVQNRTLQAVAFENRAVELWNSRDADGAVRSLDQARRLRTEPMIGGPDLVEVLIEDGLRTLATGDHGRAERSFAQALERAREDSVQRIEARLGLFAVRWLGTDRAALLPLLKDEFEALRARRDLRGAGRDDTGALRATVGWWYLTALLDDWRRRLTPGEPLPLTERELFLAAVRVVTEADSEQGDVPMMHGLIEYGFAEDAPGRGRAVALLQHSTRLAKGVILPEIRELTGAAMPEHPGWTRPPAERPAPWPGFPRPDDAPLDDVLVRLAALRQNFPELTEVLADIGRRLRDARSGLNRPAGQNGSDTRGSR